MRFEIKAGGILDRVLPGKRKREARRLASIAFTEVAFDPKWSEEKAAAAHEAANDYPSFRNYLARWERARKGDKTVEI